MIHKELNRKIQIEHHEPHNVFYTLDSKHPTHHAYGCSLSYKEYNIQNVQ
jgi:hypothetical protein